MSKSKVKSFCPTLEMSKESFDGITGLMRCGWVLYRAMRNDLNQWDRNSFTAYGRKWIRKVRDEAGVSDDVLSAGAC